VSKTAPPLEEIVLGEVRKIVCGDDVQSLALREAERLLKDEDERITEQVSALERQQADLDDRLSGLVEMRAGREIDAATFAEQQHRLKSRKAEVAGRVEEQRRELGERAARKVELDSVRAALADFDSVWDTLTGQQQRELLRTVVEELSLGRCDDGTGDVRLTLKLHFLPARVFQLPNLIKAPRAEGAAGLRPRELAYLAHRLDGLSDEAIGQQFGVPVDSVKRLARKIATDFANPDLGQVARLARPRIESVRPGLPMKGRMHRSVDHAAWHWTDRRVCVLDRLSRLVPRAAIASELGISRKTVDTHVCVMMAHAGVDSWQELVRCAREQGLITE
jgi:DNA-binding CsgD family transcriptional regulator